jgi:integrase/recombinase XerC
MDLSQFQQYLQLEKKYSLHTCEAYIRDLRQFQIFLLEVHSVRLIDAIHAMVREWMTVLLDKNVSARTVNRKMASLKAYYKFLRVQGITDGNIMTLHKSLKTHKNVQVPFSQKEMQTLLDSPLDEGDFTSLRDRCIVELLYATGMRRAELISLTLDAVDLINHEVRIVGKRNKERIVPLLPSISERLLIYVHHRNKYASSSNYFFLTEKAAALYPALVNRIVKQYLSQVSNKVKISPHILRHTFATHLLDQGAELNGVKELLGHASLASTQIYTHTSMHALKGVYNKAHPRGKYRDPSDT